MTGTVIGLLHPGEMGSAVGQALQSAGHTVLWASEGRSAETAARAAGFEDAGTTDELVRRSEVILSVCPPHAAETLAADVAQAGFHGLFVEANAIAPQRTIQIASKMTNADISFVDGGIIGPPARARGTTAPKRKAPKKACRPMDSVVAADSSIPPTRT